MQQSVPSLSEVQATFSATLFDEWHRSGLRDVVLCPGSRSTPLVLAAARDGRLTLHTRIDERSAAFFAIGRALVTGRPVAMVVTSGTAAAELHAAVAEADLAEVPLLVITADRPPELHGVGAPQTIDQRLLYGAKVRRFEEPGVARWEARSSWRPLANRLWRDAVGLSKRPGPVHLNAAFAEPLVAEPVELPEGRASGAPWGALEATPVPLTTLHVHQRRVLAVVGRGVARSSIEAMVSLHWVVLGDATAQGSTPYYDTLLRQDAFVRGARPDLVVRVGGLPASKVLGERLREWNVETVALSGAGPVADPDGLVGEVLGGLARAGVPELEADAAYADVWRRASERVGRWLGESDGDDVWLSEPLVARTVVTTSSSLGVPLVVGSSMPVRDVEWWAPSRSVATFANRGANGIDGVVSTVLGVAAGDRGIGLVGDVTFLHDVSGLVDGLGEAVGSCALVVTDNRGGGIFSFLSQRHALESNDFERLFATPRVHDLTTVAQAFSHATASVSTRGELRAALDQALSTPGLTVIVANVASRDENVRYHEALNDAVADLWSAS